MSTAVPGAPQQAPVDLRTYVAMLWRRKWVFLACVTALPVVVYAISSRAPKTYQASATVQIQSATADALASDSFVSTQTMARIARLIQTPAVARRATAKLRGLTGDPNALLSGISVASDTDGGFITITASDHDPRRAADVANAFASVTAQARVRDARAEIDRTISEVSGTLNKLSSSSGVDPTTGQPVDVTGQQRELAQQLQQLRVLRAAQRNNAAVIQTATPSSIPISPHPKRNATLALVLAGLLGLGLVYLLEMLDRRVRKTDELQPLVGAPLLATIPLSAFRPQDSTVPAAEAFQTLRASLTYFNVDRPLTSVVITSPVKGDGKTTVATNLALSIARAGKHVILVDADLRHPQVDARIGPGAESGLGPVLSGEDTLDAALIDLPVEDGRLQILPSGPPPPNPSELIASRAMKELLAELVERSDMVLIDTPPALVLSDALPLFREASGVVIVARLDHTPRHALMELKGIAESTRGTLLGVVATGAPERSGYYAYGYYQAQPNGFRNGKPAMNGGQGASHPSEAEPPKTDVADYKVADKLKPWLSSRQSSRGGGDESE